MTSAKKGISDQGLGLAGRREAVGFTLKQLTYFTAAAECASVTDAAVMLNVSPASISTAIAHLETIFDLQLFVRRHARGLVLTPNGRDMAIEASNVLNLAAEFQARGGKRSRSVEGRLEIGVLVSFASSLVPPLIRQFLDANPGADIRWHQGDLDFLISALEAGKLEVALMYDFDLPSTLRRVALSHMPPKVVLPKSHSLSGRKKISLKALADEPFILLDLPRTRDYFLSIFAELGLTPNVAYRETSVEMVRGLVGNQFGYSILNYTSPSDLVDTGPELVAIPFDRKVRSTALSAVWHYRYRMNRLAETFVESAREFMEDAAAGER